MTRGAPETVAQVAILGMGSVGAGWAALLLCPSWSALGVLGARAQACAIYKPFGSGVDYVEHALQALGRLCCLYVHLCRALCTPTQIARRHSAGDERRRSVWQFAPVCAGASSKWAGAGNDSANTILEVYEHQGAGGGFPCYNRDDKPLHGLFNAPNRRPHAPRKCRGYDITQVICICT